MANAKLQPTQNKQRTHLAKRPKAKNNRSNIPLKAAGQKPVKPLKSQVLRLNPPNGKLKRRSKLLRKALQPLLPPQTKSKKKKSKAGVTRRRLVKLSTPAKGKLLHASNTEKRAKKLLPKYKARKANGQLVKRPSAGVEGCYTGGQQAKMSRRQPVVAASSPQSLLPHPGIGGNNQKEARSSFGYMAPTTPRPAPKSGNLVVPLSSRLPIIDFISTDEFERLRNFKLNQKKRPPADGRVGERPKILKHF